MPKSYLKWYNPVIQETITYKDLFVSLPQTTTTSDETIPTNTENTMNEYNFTTEKRHLDRTARQALYTKQLSLPDQFHTRAYHPASLREYLAMMKAEQFDKLSDDRLDKPLEGWQDPADYFTLRKHQPDYDGAAKAEKELMTKFEALMLRVNVAPTPEALLDATAKVEHFRDHDCKVTLH